MDITIIIDTQGKETIYFDKDNTDAIELIQELTEVYDNGKQQTQHNK